tara:strand:+ start:2291 stop:2692 length:402 start_codon:yes stop_codon:yes gene_type:complete
MSSNKKNTKIERKMTNPSYTGPVERPIIIVGDQQVAVSTPTANKFYRYHNTLYLDKIISAFLMVGVIGYLGAYIYYSYDNNRLLHMQSGTCPVVYCPGTGSVNTGSAAKNPIDCGGKGFYYSSADSTKKICTV